MERQGHEVSIRSNRNTEEDLRFHRELVILRYSIVVSKISPQVTS